MNDALTDLRARYGQAMLGADNLETTKKRNAREEDIGSNRDNLRAGNMRVFAQSKQGRHAARGVPILGQGGPSGTIPDTDPVRALLDKERGYDPDNPPPDREEAA